MALPSPIKEELAVTEARRRGRIKAVEDWTGAISRIVVGTVATIGGALEAIDPSYFPGDVPRPGLVLGVGLGLLLGKRVVEIVSKVLEALK
jgi:hypothetical protein